MENEVAMGALGIVGSEFEVDVLEMSREMVKMRQDGLKDVLVVDGDRFVLVGMDVVIS